MAFAQGSRSTLSFLAESTFGTTPAGNFQNLPFTTHSLNLSKDQSDRQPRVDRHGNRVVGGDIVADLRHAEFDTLMQAALMSDNDFATGFTAGDGSTTVTNAAIAGITPQFFSLEDYAADIDQARLFSGCTVNTMSVSMAPNQMVSTTFGIVGKEMAVSATQKTQDASDGNAPFDAYSGDIKLGNVGSLGSALTLITAVDFTVTNNFAPTLVIGESTASALEFGMINVEGTVSAYFEDDTLLNRFLNETESALEVSVGDGTNTLTFLFPRIKVNSADVGVDGPTSRIVNMSFVALRDTSDLSASTTDTNTILKVLKSGA
jgi:hypothetical protein